MATVVWRLLPLVLLASREVRPMAVVRKHGTEYLRADTGWIPVDEDDVSERREVYAWAVERYSGKGKYAGKVKVTRLVKRYVRWADPSPYDTRDWHTWGWKVDKQFRMDESKVASYVDAIRHRVTTSGMKVGR